MLNYRIRKSAPRVFLVAIAWVLLLTGGVMAQKPAAAATGIDVGFDAGLPGSQVFVPIILNAPDGIRVGKTINEITFPAKVLEFEEARRGRSGDLADAQVTTAVPTSGRSGDSAVVEVTIVGKAGAAIPNGVVATLVFKVTDRATANQKLKLGNRPQALSADDPPHPLDGVVGRDGEVEILSAPTTIVPACFFYMH